MPRPMPYRLSSRAGWRRYREKTLLRTLWAMPEPLSVSGARSAENLYRTALDVFRLIRLSWTAAGGVL